MSNITPNSTPATITFDGDDPPYVVGDPGLMQGVLGPFRLPDLDDLAAAALGD